MGQWRSNQKYIDCLVKVQGTLGKGQRTRSFGGDRRKTSKVPGGQQLEKLVKLRNGAEASEENSGAERCGLARITAVGCGMARCPGDSESGWGALVVITAENG